MSLTLASSTQAPPRVRPEVNGRALKAHLRKAENDLLTSLHEADVNPEWVSLGMALESARRMLGWTLKQLAAEISKAHGKDRDERQVQRWTKGTEQAQFHVLWLVVALRQPLIVGLAEVAGGVEIETVVRVRRIA